MLTKSNPAKIEVKASEIDKIYPLLTSGVKCLSLDCFDTLIWRKSATPTDIFYTLQEKPTFKSLDFSARMRFESEEKSRMMRYCQDGCYEATLKDIYSTFMPDLTSEQLSLLGEEELENDKAFCYPFTPIIDLIHEAHKHKLEIIIVSDTYYNKTQLEKILAKCLPSETFAKISRIFCSCEYGVSKSGGLFSCVSRQMNMEPHLFLHLGDHPIADVESSYSAGMNSVHLLRGENAVEELNRMQGIALSYLDHTTRYTRSLDLPFRGLFAKTKLDAYNSEKMLGFAVLGPLLYAFSRFILNEITEIKNHHENVKVLFLMRDGYLPSQALEKLNGKSLGERVRISRFTTNAASFQSKQDIDKYVSDNMKSLRFEDICKQLLLPESISAPLIDSILSTEKQDLAFLNAISEKNIIDTIIENSKKYRQRLFKYLQNKVNVNPGDTIVFVDLGYSGTTQNLLQPILKKEYNIDVFGIYLIALGVPGWRSNRRGLLDPGAYDERVLQTLTTYIALLEQLCTHDEAGVIDYEDDGEPIFSKMNLSSQQHLKLKNIQDNCLQFIADAKQYLLESKLALSSGDLRDIAIASLTRLLFFPTAQELAYLKSFQFELSLGTSDLIDLFDENKGLTGLIRRGLLFMGQNLDTMRTNYPAELRYAGIELSLMLIARLRFSLDSRYYDTSLRREQINAIAVSLTTQGSINPVFEAIPTYDGYFSLNIPVGKNAFQIRIQFGLRYKWVQIESADLIPTNYWLSSEEAEFTIDIADRLTVQDMTDHDGGLFECSTDSALLIYTPDQSVQYHANQMLRIVFRPISKRCNE